MIYAIPYIVLVLGLGVLSILYSQSEAEEYKRKITIVVIITFLIFFGFRGFILTDWVVYCPYFENLEWNDVFNYFTSTNNNFEPGFAVFAMICKTIFPNFFFLSFIITLFNLYALIRFFKKYTDNIPLAFTIFMAFEGIGIVTNLMRNSIAISLFLLAIPYLEKRKPIQYFSLCLIAISFHISSFLYLPLYFFLHRRFNKWLYLTIFIIINIAFISHVSIVLTIFQLLGLDEALAQKVKAYTEIYSESINIFSIGYLERFGTGILVILYYDKLTDIHKGKGTIINAFLLFLSFYFLFSEFEVFAKRICTLFAFSYWVIWGDLLKCFFYKNNRRLFLGLIIFYCFLKTFLITRYPGYDYQNILFNAENYNERFMYYNKTYQGD